MRYKKPKFSLFPVIIKLFLACRYKSLFLYVLTLFIISVFTASVNDQDAILLYINKLQDLSEHKIKNDQKVLIQNFYLNNTDRTPLQEERHLVRKEFNSKKHKLKQEWEAQYKIKWPQIKMTKSFAARPHEKNNKTDSNTKFDYTTKDRDFDAHHIVPINAGGVNQWWNISPLTSRNHHLLHDSIEEKACFSHDFLHQKFMRFILKLQTIFLNYFRGYINKKDTNYAH